MQILCSLCFLLLEILPAGHAWGQTIWTNPGVGDWRTASNWSAGVPRSDDDAQINNGGTAQLQAAGAARDVFLGYDAGSSGTLNITGNRLSGFGTLNSRSSSIGHLGSATATVTGSMWTNSSNFYVGFEGTGTLSILSGGALSNTVGHIGLIIVSNGTVTVDGAGSTWTNSGELTVGENGTGTLRITGGGRVSSTNGFIGDRTGSNGTATVDGIGSTWTNSGGLLDVGREGMGTLSIQNGGVVNVAGGSGVVQLAAVVGGRGTLRIGNGGAAGLLHAAEVRAPGGGGFASIVFDHSEASYNFLPELTGNLRLRHEGPGTTVLTDPDAYTGGTFVDAGTLRVEGGFAGGRNVTVSGGSFDVMGGLTVGPGTVRLDSGAISADSITLAAGGAFDFLGGALHADLFMGNLTNQGGMLAPGHSAGDTVIQGNYTQQSAGTMEIEIGGPGQGSQFDFVNVTGNALVDGELDLRLINGFVPSPAQTFLIFNASSLLGVFDNAGNGQRVTTSDNGGSFLVHYGVGSAFNQNQIILSAFQPAAGLAADFDEDGDVDGADLARWKAGFSASGAATHMQGDADGDADVDGADFLVWQRQLGAAQPNLAAGAAVPEPASLLLFVGMLAACLAVAKDHRRAASSRFKTRLAARRRR